MLMQELLEQWTNGNKKDVANVLYKKSSSYVSAFILCGLIEDILKIEDIRVLTILLQRCNND